MKALTHQGSRRVSVENVADPVLQEPDDIILEVTGQTL